MEATLNARDDHRVHDESDVDMDALRKRLAEFKQNIKHEKLSREDLGL